MRRTRSRSPWRRPTGPPNELGRRGTTPSWSSSTMAAPMTDGALAWSGVRLHPGGRPAFWSSVREVTVARDCSFVAALNQGWQACGGSHIARMDADDLMHPRRLVDDAGMIAGRARPRRRGLPREEVRRPGGQSPGHGRLPALAKRVLRAGRHRPRDVGGAAAAASGHGPFGPTSCEKLGLYREGPFPEDYRSVPAAGPGRFTNAKTPGRAPMRGASTLSSSPEQTRATPAMPSAA